MLVNKQIKKLIKSKYLIKGYVDLDTQLQPHGFDFTLSQVYAFNLSGYSIINFSNECRKMLPLTRVIPTFNGVFHLNCGSYLFETNETINMPKYLGGFCLPRSSLNRAGATLNGAFIDAGYSGKLVFMVTLSSKIIFTKNARFAQIVFVKLNKTPDKLYDGIYGDRGKK